MPCPFEWPAQMFCLGKKICSRFWWLKMSLHWSTSNIWIFSVRSMRLRKCEWKRKFTINHMHISFFFAQNPLVFIDLKKKKTDTKICVFTVHSHIPGRWQNIYDWPNLVQILDISADTSWQSDYLFPFLC